MKIEILGDGCILCDRLYQNVLEALKLSGKNADVVQTLDIQKIADKKVMSMPALIVDGELKISGNVPKVEKILEWIA